ncbi:MAG: sulfurtransferase TusA family protein [Thermosediminibacteraceae bacterium]|nr:sulfurtransferase TusA family protein [Thermosediminibacteraceae bacterium]
MLKKLDARGFSCPIPVMMTKKALDESPDEHLEVLVDNPTARDNIFRYAKNSGFKVEIIEAGEDFIIKITR